jgi:hypothetical protein
VISSQNIIAWSNLVPWAEQRQIEQDLIISRAVIELFSDEFLSRESRFRGGTALDKLHFPKPLRYSEDIDLVRTTHGEIKPILRRVREVLEPWLGEASFERSRWAPTTCGPLRTTKSTSALRSRRHASLVTGIWSLRNNLTAYDAACVNARAPAERHPRDPRRAAGKRSRVGGFGHRALTGLCESPLTPPPGAAKSRHNLMG